MAEAAVPESELWIVNISAGQTRTMTLDEVDDAFNSGLINEGTMVCEVGSDLWQPLYVVAGLEPPRPTTPGSPAPPAQSSAPELSPKPHPVATPAEYAPRVNPAPIVAAAVAAPDFLAPRTALTASSSPPAGAPSPPGGAASAARPGNSPSRLPSAKTPPLPPDYMAHARPNGAARATSSGNKGAVAEPKGRTATPPTVAPKASLKATLPGTASPFATTESSARAVAGSAAPKMTSTLQGPFPVLSPPTAAVAAAKVLASQPPSSMRKAPPLPPNAFAHLAAEALAEVGAGQSSDSRAALPPSAFASAPPPLPVGAFAGSGFPSANAAAAPQFVAPAPAFAVASGAAWTETVSAGVHLAPTPAQAATLVDAQTSALPQSTGRSRAEVWTIALAAALGLLITLHRNSAFHALSATLGFKAGYESFEKAVFGEPSIDTPRGIQSLLQRTEKTREKSAATPDPR